MSSARIRNVQLDVPDDRYDAAVAFWAAALGAEARAVDDEPFTHLVDAASPVGVHLQRLDHGPARMHLDLEADEPDAVVDRLVRLGAGRWGSGTCGPVLADPAGLLVCVCRAGTVEEQLRTRGDGAGLHLVVLDVPDDDFEDVVSFWAAALEVEPRRFEGEFADYVALGGAAAPGGRVSLLVQNVGDDAARLHLDLHVPDEAARDREVARLEELGARRVAEVRHWVTLADPADLLLCVVPDEHGDGA